MLDRSECVSTWRGQLSKDLSRIGSSMKDVILIDVIQLFAELYFMGHIVKDTAANSLMQPENFLLIDRYEGQKDDKVLLNLIPFLIELAEEEDVRSVGHKYSAFLKNGPKRQYMGEKPRHETFKIPASLPETATNSDSEKMIKTNEKTETIENSEKSVSTENSDKSDSIENSIKLD